MSKRKMITLTYMGVASVVICFAIWISALTYLKSKNEMEEQYVGLQGQEVADYIENATIFGKDLDSYYGLEELLDPISGIHKGSIYMALLDQDNHIIYSTTKERNIVAVFLDKELHQKLSEKADGDIISLFGYDISQYQICDTSGNVEGSICLLYQKEKLSFFNFRENLVIGTAITGKYRILLNDYVDKTLSYFADSLNEELQRGFPENRIDELEEYYQQKLINYKIISELSIDKEAFSERRNEKIGNSEYYLNMKVNSSYIKGLLQKQNLTFLMLFILCAVIAMELTRLPRLLLEQGDQNRIAVPIFIRLISFFTCMGVYTTMPFSSILMKQMDASIFGLSIAVSASLAMTIELLAMMAASFMLPRFLNQMNLKKTGFLAYALLIGGNILCLVAPKAYSFILCRAVCGVGFALVKYFFNKVSGSASTNEREMNQNLSGFNAGLIGGITVGGAIGSVIAQVMGYSFTYYFAVVFMILAFGGMLLIFPWGKYQNVVGKSRKINIKEFLHNRAFWKSIIVYCIPLNVALMYVVAFLPVYMDSLQASPIATSYAYLLNGIAGMYLGLLLEKVTKKINMRGSVKMALFLAAAGMLILSVPVGIFAVMCSSTMLGLFDGYGTPRITSFSVKELSNHQYDTATLITLWGAFGNAIQILCPFLYSLLAAGSNHTVGVLIISIYFIIMGFLA